MIVEFDTKQLSDAIKSVSDIFARSAMSSTAGNDCLITTKKSKVIIESANQGLYVKVKIPATVEEEGKVVVNSNYLSGIRFNGKMTRISHTAGEGRMTFKSGRLKGELNVSQDADRIENQRPADAIEKTFSVPTKLFESGVSLVSFTPNATDPVLNVKIILKDDRITVLTNDPYRAASFNSKVSEKYNESLEIVMPGSFIATVFSKCNIQNTEVGVDAEMKIIKVSGNDIEVWHPVKQADIVDVNDYIKKLRENTPNAVVKFKVVDSMDAIATASSIVLGSVGTDVKMEFKVNSAKKIAHCLVEADNGKTDNSLDLDSITAEKDSVSAFVSAKHMSEFLNLMKDGTVHFYMWDDQVMLTSDDKDAIYVMPQIT